MSNQGPPMIVATEALSSPKVRIGHIGGNFTLPRTVPLASLIAAIVGALAGLIFAVAVPFLNGLTPLLYCSVAGGIAGVIAVTYSPLKGESLSRFLGLHLQTRRKAITLEGGVVQVAVGVALLKSAVIGNVHIIPGAVNVPPSQYDERGSQLDADDILRAVLSPTGLSSAATVMSGATYLGDLEDRPFTPSRRERARPAPTFSAPPVRDRYAPRPLVASPLTSPLASPDSFAPFDAPSTYEPVDLPDPEGLAEWLSPEVPTTDLADLFTEVPTPPAPVEAAVTSDSTEPEPDHFARPAPHPVSTTWSSPAVAPPGWTRPS